MHMSNISDPALHLLDWQLGCGVTDVVTEEACDHRKPQASQPVVTTVKDAVSYVNNDTSELMARTTPSDASFDVSDLIKRTRREAEVAKDLATLKQYIAAFDAMPVCAAALQPVFSDGVAGSDVMLIGEAPGQQEDEQGIPFCGASGQLLEQILNAIDLKRSENYYITNTMFWRPPGNRKPTDNEIAVCRPYVEKHIALAKPRLLVLVGATAIQSILQKKGAITKMRGTFHSYDNMYLDDPIPAIAVFHPAYLLRSPGQKKAMWEDMLRIEDQLKTLREAS